MKISLVVRTLTYLDLDFAIWHKVINFKTKYLNKCGKDILT